VIAKLIKLRRTWAKPLAWVHELTLSESEVGPAAALTNAELLTRLQQSAHAWDPHFVTAAEFFAFLRRQSPTALFDEAMFREFWRHHGRPLEPGVWNGQFPDAR